VIRQLISLGGLLAGVVLLGAPGCGGDDKPESKVVEDPYPDFASFCSGIARSQCTKAIQEACSLDTTSDTECVGEATRACSNRDSDVTRDIKSTGNYRKDRAEGCIAAVSGVYAKAKITKEDHATIRSSCDPVFRGKSVAGFECEDDLDCEEGLACYRGDLTAAKGSCEAPKTKAKGDPCDEKGDLCDKGLYCTPNDKICGARPEDTKACSAARPCLETLTCQNVDAEGNGTCGARKGSQADCLSDDECQSSFCALVGAKKICLDTLNFGTGSPVCENFDGK
jgi:hypothetical protein